MIQTALPLEVVLRRRPAKNISGVHLFAKGLTPVLLFQHWTKSRFGVGLVSASAMKNFP
ncbi:hypothetical protein SynRS9907_01415 [Synechococcus sp. RS9907]|nr:hypothetical protein SynRS9907_01415 [Synechococcus sp. RS9907]